LIGTTNIEDSLQRLDKLTQEEARVASAELLKITHNIERTVTGVDNGVKLVRGDVQDVQDVGKRVEDKLDQANRSSFPQLTTFHAECSNISQATNSEITSYNGSRPQIHPPIIILRQKLVMTARPNGSSEAVYSGNGKLLVPFDGFMESVCSSYSFSLGDASWSSSIS
jgi:hypothetical protein